ncbi:hypothetical protein COCNU_06G001590 [Cocos nucifera]|uniref:Methyltransferase type 11 domain-containing protein n=1 Tax=Cocos nucifera TaxID=13894 RepID=A0A8K0N2A0_COCNU|nr:hypothetical protein COCNU_06G001590 [Cocos nucifera]
MASGSGGHSFTASARPEQGVSPVEQVLKNVEWPEKFPFKDEDFARFDEYSPVTHLLVSHYPAGYRQDRIVGMGMNEEELKRNPVLTEYIVQDLNVNPKLPFDDNTLNVITNVVSVDYLTKPMEVFKEMQRILKPGGLAIMSKANPLRLEALPLPPLFSSSSLPPPLVLALALPANKTPETQARLKALIAFCLASSIAYYLASSIAFCLGP